MVARHTDRPKNAFPGPCRCSQRALVLGCVERSRHSAAHRATRNVYGRVALGEPVGLPPTINNVVLKGPFASDPHQTAIAPGNPWRPGSDDPPILSMRPVVELALLDGGGSRVQRHGQHRAACDQSVSRSRSSTATASPVRLRAWLRAWPMTLWYRQGAPRERSPREELAISRKWCSDVPVVASHAAAHRAVPGGDQRRPATWELLPHQSRRGEFRMSPEGSRI